MSSISIIGTGNMARTIGALAVAGGSSVEVMGRDQFKAASLARALGGGAAAALLEMGLARHGVGNWDIALSVTEYHG